MGNRAKPYQVKQVRGVILKYQLGGGVHEIWDHLILERRRWDLYRRSSGVIRLYGGWTHGGGGEWLSFFELFYRKTRVSLLWKPCSCRAFLFLALWVRFPNFLKSKIFFQQEDVIWAVFISKQLHPCPHIPTAFCTFKSCRAKLHCKIEGWFFEKPP